MKTIKLFILLFLFFNTSLVFSQVKVIYKYNGVYKELEFKSYDECGCKKWAVDFYKEGAAKPWGMSTNTSRKELETEIANDISNDYYTWKKAYSDHENYIIYCADVVSENNAKEEKETKVTSVDGILIEEVSADPFYDSNAWKASSELIKRIINAPEKNPGAIKIKGNHNSDAMGRSAGNDIPKVESMSITVEESNTVKTTATPKKK